MYTLSSQKCSDFFKNVAELVSLVASEFSVILLSLALGEDLDLFSSLARLSNRTLFTSSVVAILVIIASMTRRVRN